MRPHGFLAPPQVNPAGYQGTGKGIAPYSPVTGTINLPNEPAVTSSVPTAPAPIHPGPPPINIGYRPSPLHELGVGVNRIRELGVLGARL